MTGMKASTIKLILDKKLDNWIETIKDETLANQVKQNVIVSGGAIASMLQGEQINDYDLYFKNYETAKAIAEYYVNEFNINKGKLKTKNIISSCNPVVREETIKNIKNEDEKRIIIYMKSSGVASETQSEYEYFESATEESASNFIESLSLKNAVDVTEGLFEETRNKKNKYSPVFLSDNAITLTDKVQLIIRFYGEPEDILKNYDFVHSMCFYDYGKNNLQYHPEALESILSKALLYRGSLYPIASLFRIRKFIARGWRITAGQMLKIIWQIKDIDLEDSKVLREQLIGVDQAYMYQLLRALENKEGRVDSTYIAKLIDEIFE